MHPIACSGSRCAISAGDTLQGVIASGCRLLGGCGLLLISHIAVARQRRNLSEGRPLRHPPPSFGAAGCGVQSLHMPQRGLFKTLITLAQLRRTL